MNSRAATIAFAAVAAIVALAALKKFAPTIAAKLGV